MRTEDEVDGGGGPLDLARRAVATLVNVLSRDGCLPLRPNVEEVPEEVVGQRLGPLGEDAVRGLSAVGLQDPHATNENRHLRSGQRQHVGPVQQQGLRRQFFSRAEIVAEPVSGRLEHGERVHVRLLLRGVRAAGCERNRDVVSGVPRGLLDGRAPAQNDEVGNRDLRCAGL
jgi:hypothetical protein